MARGVIRAIKKDLPEVIVNPGAIRPLLAVVAISPSLGEWIGERMGANATFRKVAKLRAEQRVKAEKRAGGSGTAVS